MIEYTTQPAKAALATHVHSAAALTATALCLSSWLMSSFNGFEDRFRHQLCLPFCYNDASDVMSIVRDTQVQPEAIWPDRCL